MVPKKIWLPLFLIINIYYSNAAMENSDEAPNNLSQVLEHLFSKSNSDVILGHNISYLPQIFQGTIILNINYPESKAAINIYNEPDKKSQQLCNCNMTSKNSKCSCNEKQNFSNFPDDEDITNNKDLTNNANKELEHQKDKNNLDEEYIRKKPNGNKSDLTLDRANFNIELKGNHDDNDNEFEQPNKHEIKPNLLSMDFKEIEPEKTKVSKKIDRLRDLTKTNSTQSYLQKNLPLKFSQNITSTDDVLTREAVIQESIFNFQQYIPPLLRTDSSNQEDTSNTGLSISCPFPTKCVYLMYCTVDGRISNRPVILNVDEEKLRSKLLDCADEFTGRTGKCCVDPISVDP